MKQAVEPDVVNLTWRHVNVDNLNPVGGRKLDFDPKSFVTKLGVRKRNSPRREASPDSSDKAATSPGDPVSPVNHSPWEGEGLRKDSCRQMTSD